MIITNLKLTNWKNIRSSDNTLGQRVFLIGPNASGKSNYLDSFRFLKNLADKGLAKSVADRGGISSLRCLSAKQYSNIDIEVELSDDNGNIVWSYRLVLNQDSASRPVIREEKVIKSGEVVLSRPDSRDDEDPIRLTYTALEQIAENKEFREIADFFVTISYQHLLPQVVRDPRGFSPYPVKDDPFGRDFLFRMWKTQDRIREGRLKKISEALKVAVPQLSELRVVMDNQEGVPHLLGSYTHWRAHDARQYENQFSDGTLRLLGLLWTLFEGHGPLLLEEPELSLHAEVVKYLPQIFERINRSRKTKRQIIISTHSEDILGDPGIAPEEVLRLEPTDQGTLVKTTDTGDTEKMRKGLTAADVLLPKSAPKNLSQLAGR